MSITCYVDYAKLYKDKNNPPHVPRKEMLLILFWGIVVITLLLWSIPVPKKQENKNTKDMIPQKQQLQMEKPSSP